MSYKDNPKMRAYQKQWAKDNKEKRRIAWGKINHKRFLLNEIKRANTKSFEKIIKDAGCKQCHKCRQVKLIELFSKNKICLDGYRNHCRECQYSTAKQWQQNNPEKYAYCKQRTRTWLKRLKETDPVKYKAQIFLGHERRRLRHYSNGESTYINPILLKDIYSLYNHTCLKCGATEKITLDHIVPVSKGGLTTFDNLQVLCASCNSSKSDKIIDYRSNNG